MGDPSVVRENSDKTCANIISRDSNIQADLMELFYVHGSFAHVLLIDFKY